MERLSTTQNEKWGSGEGGERERDLRGEDGTATVGTLGN